jgi:hypothetical protein
MPDLQPLDHVREILTQSHLAAHVRLAQIHAILGVPLNKRGRKRGGSNSRKNWSSDYQRARRERLKAARRCTLCGQPNDRHLKTICTKCANKRKRP